MQLAGMVEHPQAASAADVLALQQRYGNRAVQRLIQRKPEPGEEAPVTEAPTPPQNAPGPEPVTDSAPQPVTDQVSGPQNPPTTENPTTESSTAPETKPTTPNPTPTTPAPTTPARTMVPGSNSNILRMQSLAHDEKVLPVLKRYMDGENASRNYNFYFDRGGNKALYAKYVADGSPEQVALPGSIKEPLDDLARAKRWSAMQPLMDKARAENQSIINNTILPSFVQSSGYQRFDNPVKPKSFMERLAGAFSRGQTETEPESEQPGLIGPVIPRQIQITRKMVPRLERGIERYTRWFENGKRTIGRVGLPTDGRALDRMYQDGHMRHARVVAIFTRRYAADSNFRAENYGEFFAKLKAFTKLWTEYKALLGR